MFIGRIIKKSSTKYTWDLGGWLLDHDFYSSDSFTVMRYNMWFEIRKAPKNEFQLFLGISSVDNLKLYLHFTLEYFGKRKDFSLNGIINWKYDPLTTVQVNNLIEITCTFLHIVRFKPKVETALQTNAIEPETVATSERKHEEGSSEVIEPEKPKSLDELCENFKDAFLDEEESDVIFKVGDKEYPAHKIIIKVSSPVFRAMLKHNMKEKEEGVINIPDCDPLIFRDFLSYIYTGKLDSISEKNVCELYQLSDKYDVKGLKKECLYFMHNSLSVDMICDVISIAATHCERNLLSRATQFFIDHAQDILESVKWQKLVEEHPTEANELFLKTFKKISRK